ncbi:hypothetical protein BDN72DRAFT_624568 [Pluteus cervinus]|uniref:Uncharacterized protein n=1 Tax=Pluteus cervinus TaxID=181527 RepID=A0ACD3AU03_9AGAR|nr:hypothetical protein BDN72DRAFT_624568 [Pluteus cervinus]
MLDAFKLKPFDLEPILADWKNPPRFNGNPKKDMPVEEWLKQIKAGCIERGIPEEYWYKVAQRCMGPKAKARLDELKAVISKVHGGKYRWTWKKFKIAMLNMGWSIDTSAKEAIKVSKTGSWFRLNSKSDIPTPPPSPPATTSTRPPPTRSNSLFWRKPSTEEIEVVSPAVQQHAKPPPPSRKNSDGSSFWPARRNSNAEKSHPPPSTPSKRPTPVKSKTDSGIISTMVNSHHSKSSSSSSSSSSTSNAVVAHSAKDSKGSHKDTEVSTVTNAPVWLLNAASALDFITSEHPKATSVISALLITAGTIPSLPGITAGAGGAVLASSATQAVGALAIGIGQVLNQSVKNSQENQQQHAQASSNVH